MHRLGRRILKLEPRQPSSRDQGIGEILWARLEAIRARVTPLDPAEMPTAIQRLDAYWREKFGRTVRHAECLRAR